MEKETKQWVLDIRRMRKMFDNEQYTQDEFLSNVDYVLCHSDALQCSRKARVFHNAYKMYMLYKDVSEKEFEKFGSLEDTEENILTYYFTMVGILETVKH